MNREGISKHPLYFTYFNMLARCYNPNYHHYHRYGYRGITVCDEWFRSFRKFAEDMGERPKGHQLDRIDNDKGYSKENCRWASKYTQMGNTSNTEFIAGVSWMSQRSKWRARIKVKGKEKHLGMFESYEHAVFARKVAERQFA